MEDLTCVICSDEYNTSTVVPVVLPLCGHTFCRSCLESIASRPGGLECPTCRKPHRDQRPALLPTNFALVNLFDTKNKNKQENKCNTHNDVIQFWCKVCDKQLCGLCLFENHMPHGDQVSKIVDFIALEKAQIKRKSQQHLKNLEERKSRSCRKFIQALLDVVCNRTSEHVLNQCLSLIEKPLDITQIRKLSGKMDKFRLTKKESDATDKSPHLDNNKKTRLEIHLADKNKNTRIYQKKNNDEINNSQIRKVADNRYENDWHLSGSSSNISSGIKSKKRKWNEAEEEGTQSELDNSRLPDVSKPDYSLAFGKATTTTSEQICSFYQKSSDRYAHLVWKNQRFHVQALSSGNKGQIKIDISVLQEYVSNLNHIEVFMELSENNLRERPVSLGYVYICVDSRTRNGQQFLAMCLGSLGPSYKGAMFNGCSEEGCGLWCGQYADGFGWTDRVTINHLGRKDCTEIKPGLVRLHKGAAFTIYTQHVPDTVVRCCVGNVVSGLAVVEAALQNNDPTKVISISNVGMVMPDD